MLRYCFLKGGGRKMKRNTYHRYKLSGLILGVTVVLSLFLIANMAMAGGTISGKVTSKRVRDPRNTLVYIEKMDGTFEPPEEHAVMNQQNLVYIPHVLPILVGTTVDFPNTDTVRHNVFSPPGSATVFNLGTYDIGITKTVVFDALGEIPVLCNVHAEMSAYIISLQNPYFYVTDRTGTFTFKDVPSGKYILKTWHEKLKSVSKEVEIKEGATVKENFKLGKKK
jgi:plastocyanin